MVRAALTSAMVGAMIAFASAVTYHVTIDLLPRSSPRCPVDHPSPIVFLLLVAAC